MTVSFEERRKKALLDWLDNPLNEDIEFDLFAVDNNKWAWLTQLIPGVILSSVGGFGSFEAQGLYHGMPFYYKERGGFVELNIGEESAFDAYLRYIYRATAKVESDRKITTEVFVETFANLVENLEVAPFLWEFQSKKVHFTDNTWENAFTNDEKETRRQWGYTPEEAYSKFFVYEEIPGINFSSEKQELAMKLAEPQPEPVNVDDRVFPAETPEFIVRVPEVWRNNDGSISIPEGTFGTSKR